MFVLKNGPVDLNPVFEASSPSSSSDQVLAGKILEEIEKAVIGKAPVLRLILLAILSNGHVLFEDLPGLAKTLTARSFAQSLGCDYKRIQFTSDLLPADITGSYVFNRANSSFELEPLDAYFTYTFSELTISRLDVDSAVLFALLKK